VIFVIFVVPMIERIDNPHDPRLSAYRELPDPTLVRARGLFIAEGRLVVRRVLEDRRWRVQSVLVNEAARTSLLALLEPVAERLPVYVCDASLFPAITGYNIHRGCLALVERPPGAPVDDVIAEARTIVVLEAVTDADNVGGIFRNAAAFGADAVLLSPTSCDPLYRKAIRTSMAAVLRVPFARFDDWPQGLRRLSDAGFIVVALTPREPAQTLAHFARSPRAKRVALVVGTEGEGLSRAVEQMADCRVRIPIEARVDSLNVAVAVGIALYELTVR
jgi:tRNA G18 (ribose-2'-O)-methylase SpoU